MPDINPLPPYDLDEAERRLMEAAVKEVRKSGPSIPQAVVRAEMLEEIARLRQLPKDRTGLWRSSASRRPWPTAGRSPIT